MSRRSEREVRLQQQISVNLSDLLAYAERRAGSTADASDALGDALEIIWRRASRVPVDATAARMYMFVVMRKALANVSRKTRNGGVAARRVAQELTFQAAAAPDPAQRSGLSLDVSRALDELPEAQVELVRLVHWEGFTIVEAAAIMEINASTARGRYAAARASLRVALEAQAVDARRESRR